MTALVLAVRETRLSPPTCARWRSPGGRGIPEDVTPHTLRHSVVCRMPNVEEDTRSTAYGIGCDTRRSRRQNASTTPPTGSNQNSLNVSIILRFSFQSDRGIATNRVAGGTFSLARAQAPHPPRDRGHRERRHFERTWACQSGTPVPIKSGTNRLREQIIGLRHRSVLQFSPRLSEMCRELDCESAVNRVRCRC